MNNKEWYPERFQEVVDQLLGEVSFVQLGSKSDPPIKGALDLRGKTSFRESAAILAASRVFIGIEGFPMHLARAVDCRSVIIYGGREDPQILGYACNENLVGAMPCAPCWQRNRCDYDRECMRMIDAEQVVAAVQKQLARYGSPIERQVIDLDSETRSGG
jgi:ADP-heptose:LPS heptosyltransferase